VKEWIEMFKAAKPVLLKQTGKGHASTSTNKQNMEHAQAVFRGNYNVTIAEIDSRLGINVAHSWCKPQV
jgi:hypothetical protein